MAGFLGYEMKIFIQNVFPYVIIHRPRELLVQNHIFDFARFQIFRRIPLRFHQFSIIFRFNSGQNTLAYRFLMNRLHVHIISITIPMWDGDIKNCVVSGFFAYLFIIFRPINITHLKRRTLKQPWRLLLNSRRIWESRERRNYNSIICRSQNWNWAL